MFTLYIIGLSINIQYKLNTEYKVNSHNMLFILIHLNIHKFSFMKKQTLVNIFQESSDLSEVKHIVKITKVPSQKFNIGFTYKM